MKRLFLLLVGLLAIQSSFACSSDNSDIENTNEETIDDGTYFGGKKCWLLISPGAARHVVWLRGYNE